MSAYMLYTAADIEFNQLCIPWYASRTDCIALYVDKTAGSQTYGHNEFMILFMMMLTQLFMG